MSVFLTNAATFANTHLGDHLSVVSISLQTVTASRSVCLPFPLVPWTIAVIFNVILTLHENFINTEYTCQSKGWFTFFLWSKNTKGRHFTKGFTVFTYLWIFWFMVAVLYSPASLLHTHTLEWERTLLGYRPLVRYLLSIIFPQFCFLVLLLLFSQTQLNQIELGWWPC